MEKRTVRSRSYTAGYLTGCFVSIFLAWLIYFFSKDWRIFLTIFCTIGLIIKACSGILRKKKESKIENPSPKLILLEKLRLKEDLHDTVMIEFALCASLILWLTNNYTLFFILSAFVLAHLLLHLLNYWKILKLERE